MAKRRIGGAGGGSDKGPRKAGAVLTGVVLAGGIAYSGGGAVIGGSGSGVTARAVANKLDARKIAKSGKGNPWSRMGMRAGKQIKRASTNCAALANRDIRAFLLRTPCRSLNRKLYPLTLEDGTVVAVSIIWVGFRTRPQAQAFADLHFNHGNGDIAPLPTTLLGLPATTFTAVNYDSRVSGTSVVYAETEAVTGSADHELLDAIAEVAVAFPKP